MEQGRDRSLWSLEGERLSSWIGGRHAVHFSYGLNSLKGVI